MTDAYCALFIYIIIIIFSVGCRQHLAGVQPGRIGVIYKLEVCGIDGTVSTARHGKVFVCVNKVSCNFGR